MCSVRYGKWGHLSFIYWFSVAFCLFFVGYGFFFCKRNAEMNFRETTDLPGVRLFSESIASVYIFD
jgi:hypothetical protein